MRHNHRVCGGDALSSTPGSHNRLLQSYIFSAVNLVLYCLTVRKPVILHTDTTTLGAVRR